MNRSLTWINPDDPLPPTEQAMTLLEGANGLLAAGTDLSSNRLIEAYTRGIFPWFSRGEPVLWWTPDPRMVLLVDEFRASKSLRKTIRKALQDASFEIRTDQHFESVMRHCAGPRAQQSGTWISPPMIKAYRELHTLGIAHCVTAHRGDQLLGGLYCVAIGKMVFGESMFSHATDGSKLALAALVGWLRFHRAMVIDCQQRTSHLASLGAKEISRKEFELMVRELTEQSFLPWSDSPPNRTDLMSF